MKWKVMGAAVLCAAVVVGCNSRKKDPNYASDIQDPYADSGVRPLGEPAYSAEPSAPDTGYSPEPASSPVYGASTAAESRSVGGVYHTVVKGDTLYSLARKYYGEQRRWRDIFDANRAQLSDPNKIKVGQRLAIP
jgi:nucleoid-associated protein YgaU